MDPTALAWSLRIEQTEALLKSRSKERETQMNRQRLAQEALDTELQAQNRLEHQLAQLQADVAATKLEALQEETKVRTLELALHVGSSGLAKQHEREAESLGTVERVRGMVPRQEAKVDALLAQIGCMESDKLSASRDTLKQLEASCKEAAAAAERAAVPASHKRKIGELVEQRLQLEQRLKTTEVQLERARKSKDLRQRIDKANTELASLKAMLRGGAGSPPL